MGVPFYPALPISPYATANIPDPVIFPEQAICFDGALFLSGESLTKLLIGVVKFFHNAGCDNLTTGSK